jgi:hypothetical protein
MTRVLIVTEGTKTEPDYLNEIRRERRIWPAFVRVLPAGGTEPLKVVASAAALLRESKEYERVHAL